MINNITTWLDEVAERFPDKTGYADEEKTLSFSQMRNAVISTAYRIYERGLFKKPDAVFMEKGVDALSAMFATAYSGNFYTPIDIHMPAARVQKILEILQPALIITKDALLEQWQATATDDIPRITLQEPAALSDAQMQALLAQRERCCDTDLLYVLFTSGSTGTPKGVTICHQSVVDYIDFIVKTFGFTEKDSLGNQAPFYFDNSILDIYTSLKTGASLYIIPEKLFAWPIPLLEYLEQNHINCIFWVPTALIFLSKLRALKSKDMSGVLTKILFCGEVMPNKHLNYWRKYIPDALYANLYGPTEITDACTYYIVDREFSDEEPLPIGIPMKNTDILVLNEKDELVTDEAGGSGELCVRGTSLSKGYYRNPEKTQAAFVQNPLNQAYPEVIYRTGDVVKYNDRGEILYLSRKDFQIKHLGYRIELGEIETAVSSIPEISLNCCLYDDKRDKLVLFIEGDMQLEEIQNRISSIIPEYMQPNRLICMEKMPLNANGKIDRVALKQMI